MLCSIVFLHKPTKNVKPTANVKKFKQAAEMSLLQLLMLGHLPGTEVPKATKAMAFTVSFRNMKHPKWEATSPITAVIRPIIKMERANVIYPP